MTAAGAVSVHGHGYDPVATFAGESDARALMNDIGSTALNCVTGRAVQRETWVPDGDPLDAALHCLSLRLDLPGPTEDGVRRLYTSDRMLSSVLSDGRGSGLGRQNPYSPDASTSPRM